ncbi:hypothetical protein AVL50_29785 [Flammeovirga sp. SJP92]|nr:hypothetical protein AVL50_29785 [Flammeovirga sp. SJP92]
MKFVKQSVFNFVKLFQCNTKVLRIKSFVMFFALIRRPIIEIMVFGWFYLSLGLCSTIVFEYRNLHDIIKRKKTISSGGPSRAYDFNRGEIMEQTDVAMQPPYMKFMRCHILPE